MELTYREAIRQSMKEGLSKNPKTLIYGLGVTDHTGIFGTTLELAQEFGNERVFNTPIAEDSMAGFGVGISLGGYYPIHIHIRNDFLLLTMNQLINSVAKYKSMYGGLFEVPMLIRAVIGRSWGQGGQHSQSIQSLLAHIPGLTVIMPSSAGSVLRTYDYVINQYRAPVISLEHRILYDYSFKVPGHEADVPGNPLDSFVVRKGKHATIIAVSVMVQEAQRAAEYVKEHENLDVEIIDLHSMTHPREDLILESVRKTGKLIVADTSWESFGVCSEVARIVATRDPGALEAPITSISMAKTTCPTSKALEKFFYPNTADLVNAIYRLHFGKENHGRELPSESWMNKNYKEFKGPF